MREYGLGSAQQYVVGPPRLHKVLREPIGDVCPVCPNCKCECLCEIEVDIKGHPLMKGKDAVGRYLGCAACPWASPMVIVNLSHLGGEK